MLQSMSNERTDTEMVAILKKMDHQVGSLQHWSDDALEILESWLIDSKLTINRQWRERGYGDED